MRDLADKARVRWAEIILNVAESLPTFNKGVIADLQSLRKHQLEWADDDFKRSRLPEGVRVKLARFFLLQLYSIEDFEAFDKTLRRLFPETSADRLQELRKGMQTLSGVSWSYVGHIVRMRKPFYPGELAIIEELPTEIEDISVEIQQVLPSLLVLAFGIRLAENLSTQLTRLYEARYLEVSRVSTAMLEG
jgi:hypothetical protein